MICWFLKVGSLSRPSADIEADGSSLEGVSLIRIFPVGLQRKLNYYRKSALLNRPGTLQWRVTDPVVWRRYVTMTLPNRQCENLYSGQGQSDTVRRPAYLGEVRRKDRRAVVRQKSQHLQPCNDCFGHKAEALRDISHQKAENS
jgi:hypothetical protein